MIIDFAAIAPPERYQWMTQTVIPRPVAWILSENRDGGHNLAPFSYFNAIASEPPLIAVSFTAQPDSSCKDTLINIRERSHFVVHIASMQMLDALNDSSATLDYGVSEIQSLGLQTTDFDADLPLPRLQDAKVAMFCRLHQEVDISPSQSLILGKISKLYIDDGAIREDAKGRSKADAAQINPVGRLGAGEYAGIHPPVAKKRPS